MKEKPKPGLSPPDEAQLTKWLEMVATGVHEDQRQALTALTDSTQANPGNPQPWNYLALALGKIGQHGDALNIFERLVKAYPKEYIYRLSLATTYTQTMEFELARHHLEYLRDHATDIKFREIAEQQLAGMTRFLGQTSEEREQRELQIAALEETIQSGDATAHDYTSLAAIYLQQNVRSSEAEWLALATRTLEAGHARFPQDARIVEFLIRAYLPVDQAKCDVLVRKLEKLDPHSPVLKVFSNVDSNSEREHTQRMQERINRAMENLQSGNKQLQDAAVKDLRVLVQQFPDNPQYRVSLAWGLLVVKDLAGLLAEARVLEHYGRRTHEFHFNLGQFFWFGGDKEKGREHLQLAGELARNDGERQDVRQRIRELESYGL